MAIEPSAVWDFAREVVGVVRPDRGRTLATVTRVDADGTTWVTTGDGGEAPASSAATGVSVGDTVSLEWDGSAMGIRGNVSNPSPAGSVVRRAVERTRSVADAAKSVAEAVNQHFFSDTSGIHVTEAAQDEWETSHTGANVLLNSAGQLFRDGLNNLLTLTTEGGARALTIWDGLGNAASNVRAVIGEVITLGGTGESHAVIDYHSLQLVDRDGYTYLDISELQDRDGNITERFEGVLFPIAPLTVDVSFAVETLVRVTVDSENVTSSATFSDTTVSVPMEGGPHEVVVVYKPYFPEHYYYANYIKAYTLGVRKDGQVGGMSTVLGYRNMASGLYSYAEGATTESRGTASHAEGYGAIASGDYSHAQNHDTIAASDAQTAMGCYNANDPAHALEIGNGTSDSARSNALAVGWDGSTDLGPMPLSDAASGVHVHGSNVSTTDETASSGLYGLLVGGFDKDGNLRSYLKHVDRTDGKQGIQLETRRSVNGSNVYNGIELRIDPSGNRTVTVSDAAAWRSAIGMAHSTSSVTTQNSTWVHQHCYANAVMGMVTCNQLRVSSALANGGSVTIGTVPSGYRPPFNVYATVCSTSATAQGGLFVLIDSSGVVTLYNRSGSSLGTGTSLYFTATYTI